MQIAYPFRISGTGRTASEDQNRHIRNMIEQVLFTAPGERVNRPDLGTGLQRFVFATLSDETLAATRFMVQSALQEWLGDLIEVEGVDVEAVDTSLVVTVRYRVIATQQRQMARFNS